MTPQEYIDKAIQVLITSTGMEWFDAREAAQDLQKAGLLPSDTEWAIESKTFFRDDAPFDKRETTDWSNTPLTEQEAREDVSIRTSARGQFSPETMRVVSRGVTDWRPTP